MPKQAKNKPKKQHEWVFAILLFVFFAWLGQLELTHYEQSGIAVIDAALAGKRSSHSEPSK
ncbi:MAG: hypothetical protein ISP86_00965 [Shewanellaceae bacterium]|nr:hypothetical protein [Shewanellaceae bacterium]